MSEETCPDCGRVYGEDRYHCRSSLNDVGLADCLRHAAARQRTGNEQTSLLLMLEKSYTSTLEGKLSAATARASELERALVTETKARELSWAHHDEHHERDAARWLKMCQALGKVADDGSPGIAWPAIFDLVSALGERVARAELQLKALDLLCGLVSEEDGTVVFRVLEGGQRHCQARLVPARGDNAGRAALDLATKLGLLQPETKL